MALARIKFLGILVAVLVPICVSAQSVNYIDESGNIMFADNINKVPFKYRSQLIKPTPGPATEKEYKKEVSEYHKKLSEMEKERRVTEKALEKEQAKKKKKHDQEVKQRKKELEAAQSRRDREQDRLATKMKDRNNDD